jgi:polysaccharide biosynthesis protein PslG
MRRSPFTRIASCLVAAAALLSVLAPGTSMAAEKGLSVDLTWGIRASDQDRTASLLPDVGAKWVRLTFEWNKLESHQGSYDSATLAAWDRSVSLSRQAGSKVVVTVYGTPSWASVNGKVAGAPSNNAYYANLMSFLANRYRGQVQAWEIWNEENVSRFWSSGPDPARYAGLLRAAYPAVKAADPGATVVFGGTSGNDTGFIDGAYRAGAKGSFDVMAVHPYTGSAPEAGGGLYSFPGYREVRDLMLRNGDGKPIWLTEFGWSTTSDNWGVSQAVQADYLLRAYRMLEQDPYVQVAIWYNFRNNWWDRDADGWEFQCGLMRTDFTPKPSYAAFKAYVPGVYVPTAPKATASGSGSASTGSTPNLKAPSVRTATRTSLRVILQRPRSARASLRSSSSVLVRGAVRGAKSGRVTIRIEPARGARAGASSITRAGVVSRDGRFEVSVRLRSGRWRVRAAYRGTSKARPSTSRYLYFRV